MAEDAKRRPRMYVVHVGLNFVLGGVCSSPLMYALYKFHLVGGRWSDMLLAVTVSAVTGAVGGYSVDRNWRTSGAFAAAFAMSPLTGMVLYTLAQMIPTTKEGPGVPVIVAAVLVLPALSYGIIGMVGALLARSCRRFKTGVVTAFAIAGAVGGLCSPLLVGVFSSWALRPFGAMMSMYSGEILTLFLAGAGLAFVLRRGDREVVGTVESAA